MRGTAPAAAAGAAALVVLMATGERAQSQPSSLSALPRTAVAAGGRLDLRIVELGRLLFWDPILSGHRDVACATCHHPDFAYAENLDISIGVGGVGLGASRRFARTGDVPFVKRNSQTVLNVAFNGMDAAGRSDPARAPMFWDLGALGLEAQALEPIKTFEEMRGSAFSEAQAVDHVVSRLQANGEYRKLFAAAFGPGPTPVTADRLAKALAEFQGSLVAADTPFDRYMRGDTAALSAAQVRGMRRFEQIGCANCHSGPMFSDFKPHVLGVPDNPRLAASDAGMNASYAFRTPSLRNLRRTAPYMHSGVFATLDDVVDFYDDVTSRRARIRNRQVSRQDLDPLLRDLRDVDRRSSDLVAFLEALSDDGFDRTIPARVPSGLPPGGAIQD
jgi:cytochrome c peroxidase